MPRPRARITRLLAAATRESRAGCQSYPSGRGPFGCLAIFTEGFDTRDLKEAKALLEELGA
jgi:hypothetical protein